MTLKSYAASDQDITFSDSEFHERLRLCSPEQLEQCVRLLGMYIALYKRDHGELKESAYSGLLSVGPTDIKLAELMVDGMDEANAMLLLIQSEPKDSGFPAPRYSNRLN